MARRTARGDQAPGLEGGDPSRQAAHEATDEEPASEERADDVFADKARSARHEDPGHDGRIVAQRFLVESRAAGMMAI